MSDYKIFLNRKQPSDEEIQKTMDFEALLNQYQNTVPQTPKVIEVPFYKRPTIWYSAAAVVVLALGMFWWMNKDLNKLESQQNVTQVETTPETKANPSIETTPNKEQHQTAKTPEQTTKPVVADNSTTTSTAKSAQEPVKTAVNAKSFNADSAIAALPPLPPKPIEPEKATSKPTGFNFKKEDFPELSQYDGVYWAVLDQRITDEDDMTIKGADDKVFGDKNSWSQTSVKKVSVKEYEVKLARKDGYKATLKMKPVFFGEGYTKAMAKYQTLLAEYNKAAEERAKKEAEFRNKAKAK